MCHMVASRYVGSSLKRVHLLPYFALVSYSFGFQIPSSTGARGCTVCSKPGGDVCCACQGHRSAPNIERIPAGAGVCKRCSRDRGFCFAFSLSHATSRLPGVPLRERKQNFRSRQPNGSPIFATAWPDQTETPTETSPSLFYTRHLLAYPGQKVSGQSMLYPVFGPIRRRFGPDKR